MRTKVCVFGFFLALFSMFVAFWRYAPLEWTTPRLDIIIAACGFCVAILTVYTGKQVADHMLAIREQRRIVTDISFNNGNISWTEFRETFFPMMKRCGANGDESGVQVLLP